MTTHDDLMEDYQPLFQLLVLVQISMADIARLMSQKWPMQSQQLLDQGFIVAAPETLTNLALQVQPSVDLGVDNYRLDLVPAERRLDVLSFFSGMVRQMPDQADLDVFDGFLDWFDAARPLAMKVNELLKRTRKPDGVLAIYSEIETAVDHARNVEGRNR